MPVLKIAAEHGTRLERLAPPGDEREPARNDVGRTLTVENQCDVEVVGSLGGAPADWHCIVASRPVPPIAQFASVLVNVSEDVTKRVERNTEYGCSSLVAGSCAPQGIQAASASSATYSVLIFNAVQPLSPG